MPCRLKIRLDYNTCSVNRQHKAIERVVRKTLTMKVRTFILASSLFALTINSCSKKLAADGCPTGKICTEIFAAVNVNFVDAAGKPVAVKDVSVINQRTKEKIVAKPMFTQRSAGTYTLVTDANKKQLSTDGDVLILKATAVSSNKPITEAFNIAGGCSCHVRMVEGEPKIVVK